MHDLQTTSHLKKSCLVIIELVIGKFLLYIVNKHPCNMFTMCRSFFQFFTVTGIDSAMHVHSKYRIGNRKLNSKLAIVIFHINSINFIESENLRKPR